MMKLVTVAFASLAILSTHGPGSAQPKPPESAKPLTGEQITQQLANRTFKFVVHDAGVEAYGTSTWDSQKSKAYGDYVWGSSRGKWTKEWKVTGDKNCFRDVGTAQWECYSVHLDGMTHYEVREDGLVHSVSTLVSK